MNIDEIVKALTTGAYAAGKLGKRKDSAVLLKLRQSIKENGMPNVWTNGKAFRKYQSQDKTYSLSKIDHFKGKVIIIKEED